MHMPVSLLPVYLVMLLLLLLQVLGLQQLLKIRPLGFYSSQSFVFLLQLAELFDFQEVISSSSDDGDEFLGADDGGGSLDSGQAYIYSALF